MLGHRAPGPSTGCEMNLEVGLRRRADGDPAHLLYADVVAHLEAEDVAVEHERLVVVVDDEECESLRFMTMTLRAGRRSWLLHS